jgi:hypothetical protein
MPISLEELAKKEEEHKRIIEESANFLVQRMESGAAYKWEEISEILKEFIEGKKIDIPPYNLIPDVMVYLRVTKKRIGKKECLGKSYFFLRK